ncbi:CUB and sushi domain-containing protein 1 [Orchesella cincta]|uniref:CUB and sushi domain-containing protein 1 n=1 Tax=Orchesella cincta TaxID=48709 RepID=A0A1D2M4E3_ORCCI|nr:CUB and sushi domain-containing protein 1 [Orchesella cincta]
MSLYLMPTINQQSMQVANMMSLSNETSRTVKLLQYAHGQDKVALIQQISNLTMLIEKLQRERSEDRARTRTELSLLQAKIVDLEKSSGPQWAEQTVGCGGVLIANSGLISYKFRQLYMNDERCVWTVRVNTRSKINLQLLEDGFQNQSNSDFLTVTEFGEADDQHPVTLLTSTRLEHGSKALHTFQGPVIFITFYSDSSIPGTGFTLRFDGVGNITDSFNINAIRHINLHQTFPTGKFTYPSEENGPHISQMS